MPYPKKQYFWIQRSAAQGVTPAELYVDFVMRADQPPTKQMFERWRKPDAYPNLRYSTLAVAFPLNHPLAQPERFLAWVSELDVARHRRFLCATAGYCLLRAINAPTFESGQRAGHHAGAMLLRHPGLDVARWVHAALAVHDVEYVERMRQPVAKPLIRRANWLNFLGAEQVALLGGTGALQSRFDDTPTIRLTEFAHGLLIRAGDAPQWGDAAAGLFPKEYCEVATALAPCECRRSSSAPWAKRSTATVKHFGSGYSNAHELIDIAAFPLEWWLGQSTPPRELRNCCSANDRALENKASKTVGGDFVVGASTVVALPVEKLVNPHRRRQMLQPQQQVQQGCRKLRGGAIEEAANGHGHRR